MSSDLSAAIRKVATEIKPPEPPPEAAQLGAVVWLRKNLFSTPFNSAVTVILAVVGLLTIRGALGFLLDSARRWDVVPRNSVNYIIEAYPRDNLERMWLSLDIALILVGLSLAGWRPKGSVPTSTIVAGIRGVGAVLLVLSVLAPSGSMLRTVGLVAGVVLIALTVLALRRLEQASVDPSLPTVCVVGGAAVLVTVALWALNSSTSANVQFTLAVALGAVAYGVGRRIVRRVNEQTYKLIAAVLWLLFIPVAYLQIQRNPLFDVDRMIRWLTWAGPILLVGFGAIWLITRLRREAAGVVNAVVVIAALGSWAISMPMVARFMLIMLVFVGLATPTFGTGETGRRNMGIAWAVLALFTFYLFAVGAASPGIHTEGEYFGGFNLTLMLALAAILLSFPIGILLALGRTSKMPVFRLMSTAYIEVVRGVPLITVLFFFVFVIPNFMPRGQLIAKIATVLIGLTLFSAAYLAENVRGGLQSIPKGQYEAAKALGMTTAQMTLLITLPQALRAVIPAIVGQVISLFKDTSLVSIVGLADFFRVATKIVPNQPNSLGSIIENLFLAAVVYWVFTFSFSRASLRLEKRLGVGTR